MSSKRAANAIFGIGSAILFIFGMWFFLLYGIANPYAYQKLDITEPRANQTQNVIIIYHFDVTVPQATAEQKNNEITSILDGLGTILIGITTGVGVMIAGRILNRFWPDKSKSDVN